MDITIHGRNLDLDEATRNYVVKKLEHVGTHINNVRSATVQVSQEATRRTDQRFSVQITLDANGSLLRSEERAASPRAAIDAAAHVLDRRVRRLKARVYQSMNAKHSGASIRFEAPEAGEAPTEEDEKEGRVVRVKRFPIKPMTVEEAMFQIEMLGHSFFLFQDTENQEFKVLYKRQDGEYGLIIPERL